MPTKQDVKQLVRRTIGEPYVGKRMKQRLVARALDRLALLLSAIIDAGTEDAVFVYWLADRWPGASVTAVDIDEHAIAACAAARPGPYERRVSFRCSAFADIEPTSVDLIAAFDVLEHIEDDQRAMDDLARALRPGGTILVHVPRDRWTHVDGRVEVVPDDEAWKINEGHVRMGYSPERLTALVEEAGLVVDEIDLWVRRWGVRAFAAYSRLEHPTPLRLLSIPFTELATVLDRRRPASEGNYVWMVAHKPGRRAELS